MRGVGRTRPAEKAKEKAKEKVTEEKKNMKAMEDLGAKEDSRTRER